MLITANGNERTDSSRAGEFENSWTKVFLTLKFKIWTQRVGSGRGSVDHVLGWKPSARNVLTLAPNRAGQTHVTIWPAATWYKEIQNCQQEIDLCRQEMLRREVVETEYRASSRNWNRKMSILRPSPTDRLPKRISLFVSVRTPYSAACSCNLAYGKSNPMVALEDKWDCIWWKKQVF